MDAGFFRKRVSSNVINLERNDTATTISKPTTGGAIKRGQTKGFTIENINDKIKLMNKHAPKGNWRRFKKEEITYTKICLFWGGVGQKRGGGG